MLAMSLGALRYKLFLPSSASMAYVMGVTLFQNAVLTFVPWRVGEVSYPLLLRSDHNIPVQSSAAVILVIRLVDLLVILAVALVCGSRLGTTPRGAGIIVVVVLFFGALIAWVAVRRHHVPVPVRTIIAVIEPFRRPLWLATFLLLSLAVFTLTTLQSMFILHAVALMVTPSEVALLNALTLLAALLPVHPPGGWGTVDAFQIALLERLGYSPGSSGVSILSAHSLYTVLILLGGVAGWLLRTRSRPVPPKDRQWILQT